MDLTEIGQECVWFGFIWFRTGISGRFLSAW